MKIHHMQKQKCENLHKKSKQKRITTTSFPVITTRSQAHLISQVFKGKLCSQCWPKGFSKGRDNMTFFWLTKYTISSKSAK